MSGIATAVVVAGVGGALISANAASSAAKKQASAIDKASGISSEAATQARADAIALFSPALADFSKSIQASQEALAAGRTSTLDVLRQTTGNADQLLQQGADAAQRAILGLPPQPAVFQPTPVGVPTAEPTGPGAPVAARAFDPNAEVQVSESSTIRAGSLFDAFVRSGQSEADAQARVQRIQDRGLQPALPADIRDLGELARPQGGLPAGQPQVPTGLDQIRTTQPVGQQQVIGQAPAPGIGGLPTGLAGAESALGQSALRSLLATGAGFQQARGDIGAARGAAAGAIGAGIGELRGGETRGLGEIARGVTGAVGELERFAGTGEVALMREAALAGALGPEAQAQAIAEFQESPGQMFLRERQEQALLRSSAAIGGLGGGRVRTALQEQAVGIAAQQQQQQLLNLRSLGAQGLQAAGVQAGFRQQGGLTGGQLVGQLAGQAGGLRGQQAGIEAQLGTSLANLAAQRGLTQGQTLQALGQQQAGLRTTAGGQLGDIALGTAGQRAQAQLGFGGQVAGVEQQTAANIANLIGQGGAGQADLRTRLASLLGNISVGQGTQQAQFAGQIGQAQAAGTLGQAAAIQQGVGGLAQAAGSFQQQRQNQQLLDILAQR